MKYKRWFLLAGLMLILLCPGWALGEKLTGFYVQPEAATMEKQVQAVDAWKKKGVYYLFLPAGMDTSSLAVYFEGPQVLTLGEETLLSGQATGQLQPDAQLSLQWDGGSATVKVMQSQNISAMFITTESGNLEYIQKEKGNEEKGNMTLLSPEGSLSYQGGLEHVKVRGNGTSAYGKKPYQIKLNSKADLLGMGEAKTWVLLANYLDNSLLRNKIAFELGRAVGMEYTSQSAFVDLYINHEYQGNYQLCEKVQVGKNRIDIFDLEKATEKVNEQPLSEYEKFGHSGYKSGTSKGRQIPNDPEDITGGYLVEMELTYRYNGEASGFVTSRGQTFVIKSPKYASQAQVAYISDLFGQLEDALFSQDGINPTTGKHWYEYIDQESYVKKYLIEEVLKNYDANRSSQFFYKPADDESTLIYAAPPWDFDQSMDNYGEAGANLFSVNVVSTKFHWFPRAYKKTDFRQALEKCYAQEFVPLLKVLTGESPAGDSGLKSIREYAAEIEASAAMNYVRFPQLTEPTRYTRMGTSFEESVDKLVTFLTKRMAFLEKHWMSE